MTQKDLGDKIGKTWEMVSRYERGVSSPFKQIDSLADALNVDSSELLKKPSENKNYLLNRVPLFTTIPENMDFLNTKAYEYYTAPDWMLDRDLQCFVIDPKLIDIRDNRLDDDGYLFISPNLKNEAKQDDLVLKINGDQLVASKRFNSKEDTLVGKVLAQEVRF